MSQVIFPETEQLCPRNPGSMSGWCGRRPSSTGSRIIITFRRSVPTPPLVSTDPSHPGCRTAPPQSRLITAFPAHRRNDLTPRDRDTVRQAPGRGFLKRTGLEKAREENIVERGGLAGSRTYGEVEQRKEPRSGPRVSTRR